jgi:acetyl esterase/lipase
MNRVGQFLTALVVSVLFPSFAAGQLSESADWALNVASDYRVVPNVTYLTTNNWDGKLDLYVPRNSTEASPTLIYIHGGAHVAGSKEQSVLSVLPYLNLGWAVVNVGYRLGHVSRAPAAVEDCICAVRWVIEHADEYGLNPNLVIVSGASAGSHLALSTAMIPASTGLDRQCPGQPVKLAAVINWFGLTDVLERLEGPHSRPGTVAWFGSNPERRELAEFVSPIKYVREGLPPIITIHGDQDPRVPYTQATRLHEGLDRVGVPNQLVTISGGGHGGFSRDEMNRSFVAIQKFLADHVFRGAKSSSASLR